MEPAALIRRAAALLDRGATFAAVRVLPPASGGASRPPRAAGGREAAGSFPAGGGWIIHRGGRVEGAAGAEAPGASASLLAALAAAGEAAIAAGRARRAAYEDEEGSLSLFADPMEAAALLVVAGAGHIALPLVDMAAQTGFRVVVVDDRPEFAAAERFPRAERVVAGPFGPSLAGLDLGPRSHVVVITRGHRFDSECLEAVLPHDTAYLGMIGSRRRVRTVLDRLAAGGAPADRLARVHTPIGLDIGAVTPAEIAVSILAELVAVRRLGGSPLSIARAGKSRRRAPSETGGPGENPHG